MIREIAFIALRTEKRIYKLEKTHPCLFLLINKSKLIGGLPHFSSFGMRAAIEND